MESIETVSFKTMLFVAGKMGQPDAMQLIKKCYDNPSEEKYCSARSPGVTCSKPLKPRCRHQQTTDHFLLEINLAEPAVKAGF